MWRILFLLFLSGCASINTPTLTKEPLYNHKADMIVTVDGVSFDGMAVTELNGKKEVVLKSRASADVFVVSTCQRYEKFENIGKSWFGSSAKELKYIYSPTSIELEKKCPVYFQAFDMNGITDWGYLAYRRDKNVMPARTECNGRSIRFSGHSVCQTKAGLEQSIRFDVPVKYFSADPGCNVVRVDDRSFRFRPSLGFCAGEFSDGTNFHQLTALGFDAVFIRGEK
jgi:hypothetical protein